MKRVLGTVLGPAFSASNNGLVLIASLLVPAGQRSDWRREWRAELWHARKARVQLCEAAWQRERAVFAFCLGAVPDALCLRRDAPRLAWRGSASQYLLILSAVLAASYALALVLPQVRAAVEPLRSTPRSGVILLQQMGPDYSTKSIPFARYRTWATHRHRYFDAFAFYRIAGEKVAAGADAPSTWQVADGSANLFTLLGLPVQLASPEDLGEVHQPRVILSSNVWRSEFGGNPGIVGSELRVGHRTAKIVGVAANRLWRLPGQPDAWLLEPDANIPGDRMGHVIAHLTRQGRSEMWADRVNITVYNKDHSEQDYLGIAFDDRPPGPWEIYQFSVLLALLALPAITTISLGEYSVSSHRPPWPRRIVRWAYLTAKLALLLPIAYFVSLDCAYWHASQHSLTSEYVQLALAFSICLFGTRWALLDQRQRCPVCLQRVAHPAQVGLASRTFLAWNGTELMCTGGHTLLHVPGLPTSWFGTQRWLYLDSSWEFLFAGTDAG